MANMYKSRLNIGGKEKTVVVINHKTEEEMSTQKSVDCLHHIHVLDRSGSMTRDINELIENVKSTIEFIPETDYVSVIWFSGTKECKTLIKGSKKDKGLFKLLDTLKSTIGCTCFSEPLQEVGVIINDLKAICPNFNVTLFTDGQPVVPWNNEEERIFEAIDVWKNDVLALNTVGYGNYYNQKLMREMADKTQFGQLIHSSKIDEYMDIFSHNYERVSDLVLDKVEISTPASEVMYINSKSTKIGDLELKMTSLEKKKNQFVIISDDKVEDFTYNGDVFSSKDIKNEIPAATLTPVIYAYAYEQYYKGNRQYALDILAKNLFDKYLIDEQMKAFTFDEVSDYMKKFKKAVFSSKGRYLTGKCDAGYIPKDDALCVMDILKMLVEGDNYYVYAKNYNRIGLKSEDTFNLFEKDDGDTVTPLNELVFNKEQLNVSIRSKITGTVKLNPKQAERVGLPAEVKSQMFRNQTIIKDGNLNMDYITVVLDDETFSKLVKLNKLFVHDSNEINNIVDDNDRDILVDEAGLPVEMNGKEYVQVKVYLNLLPIVNRTYITEAGKIEKVFTATKRITELENQQKVAGYFLKEAKKNHPDNTEKRFSDYTLEQIDVLKDHGLSKSLDYAGVDVKTAEKVETDFYEARVLDFDIKGFSTLPAVPDVIKKIRENGKLNGPATIMKDYINTLINDCSIPLLDDTMPVFVGDVEFFEKEVKRIKERLMEERIKLCSMKIAKVLTGDWFDNLQSDGKGGYTYVAEGMTMNVSADKKKMYF